MRLKKSVTLNKIALEKCCELIWKVKFCTLGQEMGFKYPVSATDV